MSGNSSGSEMSAVAQRLADASSIVIISHVRPDGDAVGSMLAIVRAAQQAGKQAWAVATDKISARYRFLSDRQPIQPPERFDELAARADLVLVVDTCSHRQLGELADAIERLGEHVAVIDHHATSDAVGDVRWIDPSAAATGVLAARMIDRLGWPVDLLTLEMLATAVLTDTGWFRFSNTSREAMNLVGRWIDAGGQIDELYRNAYQQDRPQRLRLLATTLSSLELPLDGRVGMLTIRRRDLDAVGAREDETEDFVNEPLRIAAVEVSVLLSELTPQRVRASLRSRGNVDVAQLARQLGGGGHTRAAGVTIEAPLPAARQLILDALERTGKF